jgi:hypothetical protein
MSALQDGPGAGDAWSRWPIRETRSGLTGFGGAPVLHPAWCEPEETEAPTRRLQSMEQSSFSKWLELRSRPDEQPDEGD